MQKIKHIRMENPGRGRDRKFSKFCLGTGEGKNVEI